MFSVSVIMPVFNAAAYVRRAVESAVALEDVHEVILVEDGSPDNALEICERLQHEYSKVKLLQHPGGRNMGAGASRNLGLQKATCPFVAFLDADDYYLSNRFKVDREILSAASDIDGVFNAIGATFYSEEGRQKFLKHRSLKESDLPGYTTMLKPGPGEVYWRLMQGRYGYCHTNGITFRKSIFSKVGMFNTSLRLHQDTELWIRASFHCKLVQGAVEAVAMRGVHSENRIHSANKASKFKYFSSLFHYFKSRSIPFQQKLFLYRRMMSYHPKCSYSPHSKGLRRVAMVCERMYLALLLSPQILQKS